MKVTVCFGSVRVVVPCGKGDISVSDLQQQACARYKKAIGKTSSYWVRILQLGSAVDGGILDWDDLVYDVIEDKEKLIASFEEEDRHGNEWELGSVTSSEGTPKRNPRYLPNGGPNPRPNHHSTDNDLSSSPYFSHNRDTSLEVDVGVDTLKSNSLIVVRSDYNSDVSANNSRNNSLNISRSMDDPILNGASVRYPVAQHHYRNPSNEDRPKKSNHRRKLSDENEDKNYFRRDKLRQSMASGLSESIDENEREFHQSGREFHQNEREFHQSGREFQKNDREFPKNGPEFPQNGHKFQQNEREFQQNDREFPKNERELYQSDPKLSFDSSYPFQDSGLSSIAHSKFDSRSELYDSKAYSLWFYKDSQEVILLNDGSPLGLKVIAFTDPKSGRFAGLEVGGIEEGSRVDEDNLLSSGDVIVEVNHQPLLEFSAQDSQLILKDSLHYPEIQFRILPVEEKERQLNGKSPARGPQSRIKTPQISLTTATPPKFSDPQNTSHSKQDASNSSASSISTHESNSTSNKVPLIAQQSYDNIGLYTRKIGNRINIQLKKESLGLGFSLTARDTTIGDPGPIYIKNIMPKGAAIVDGRLRAGDRLLEINGKELTGMSQQETVNILRGVAIGETVDLTISRQLENLYRKMKEDPEADKLITEDSSKEHFMFDIALNDTGSAGLGISLKGNQSKKTGKDLGIFIKSIFHGGAAWQDGRLRANDQLVEVNSHPLTGATNHEAIDILRASMSTEGNVRGMIEMVVARRRTTGADGRQSLVSSEASSDLSDSILEHLHTTPARTTAHEIVGYDHHQGSYGQPEVTQADSKPPADLLARLRPSSPSNHDTETSDEEWPAPGFDPFDRESVVRQSISEKRREAVPRFNTATKLINEAKLINNETKLINNETKLINSDLDKNPSTQLSQTKSLQKNISRIETQFNNNNSTVTEVDHTARHRDTTHAQQNDKPFDESKLGTFRKSISTESLVAPSGSQSTQISANQNIFRPKVEYLDIPGSNTDFGPTLGIAKSSSLESLQTAVENCVVANNGESPYPRPLPKVVRGRILNDSFRAALDKSYDMTSDLPPVKHMAISTASNYIEVREEEDGKSPRSSTATSSDGSTTGKKAAKRGGKGNKLFGLFKMNKSKRSSEPGGKVSESEMHKRSLEARREKDFERMKDENDRIQEKARELRNKQAEVLLRNGGNRSFETPRAPSVPVTAMQRISDIDHMTSFYDSPSGRHSVDPSSQKYRIQQDPPPRSRRYNKEDKMKFKEAANTYSSLPRQPRRDGLYHDSGARKIGTLANGRLSYHEGMHDRNAFRDVSQTEKKVNNIEFYNRQKPQSLKQNARTLVYDDRSETVTDSKQKSHYKRELSPRPPSQNFYVSNTNNGVVLRRSQPNAQPRSKAIQYRHSLYTDSLSSPAHKIQKFPRSPSVSQDPNRLAVANRDYDSSGAESYRTVSPTSSEAAENNRETYHKLMNSKFSPNAGLMGNIEVSVPYNL